MPDVREAGRALERDIFLRIWAYVVMCMIQIVPEVTRETLLRVDVWPGKGDVFASSNAAIVVGHATGRDPKILAGQLAEMMSPCLR